MILEGCNHLLGGKLSGSIVIGHDFGINRLELHITIDDDHWRVLTIKRLDFCDSSWGVGELGSWELELWPHSLF